MILTSVLFNISMGALGIASLTLMLYVIFNEGNKKPIDTTRIFEIETKQEVEYIKILNLLETAKDEADLLRCGCLVKAYQKAFGDGLDVQELFEQFTHAENRIFSKRIPPYEQMA